MTTLSLDHPALMEVGRSVLDAMAEAGVTGMNEAALRETLARRLSSEGVQKLVNEAYARGILSAESAQTAVLLIGDRIVGRYFGPVPEASTSDGNASMRWYPFGLRPALSAQLSFPANSLPRLEVDAETLIGLKEFAAEMARRGFNRLFEFELRAVA